MPSHAQKLAVFDDALAGMLGEGRPDMLLVACNTLSVLIPESRVLAAQSVPVVGIVEGLGLRRWPSAWRRSRKRSRSSLPPRRRSTPARIAVPSLPRASPRNGSCHSPARDWASSRIELEGRSVGVVEEIARFARQAVARTGRAPVALACTHYGYCAAIFAAMLRRAGAERVDVLDPNRKMSELFFPTPPRQPAIDPQVSVRVVSRAIPLPGETARSRLVEPVSPATAAAPPAATSCGATFLSPASTAER